MLSTIRQKDRHTRPKTLQFPLAKKKHRQVNQGCIQLLPLCKHKNRTYFMWNRTLFSFTCACQDISIENVCCKIFSISKWSLFYAACKPPHVHRLVLQIIFRSQLEMRTFCEALGTILIFCLAFRHPSHSTHRRLWKVSKQTVTFNPEYNFSFTFLLALFLFQHANIKHKEKNNWNNYRTTQNKRS